jgi:hypothetical protein
LAQHQKRKEEKRKESWNNIFRKNLKISAKFIPWKLQNTIKGRKAWCGSAYP